MTAARPRSWLLAAEAAVLLAASWVLLRLWRIDRILEWLTPTKPPPADWRRVHEAGRFVDRILSRLPKLRGRSCLIRSLALYSMVRRSGIPVTFRCGVRKVDGTLDGHAWLTYEGKPFLEPYDPAAAHAVVFSFPPS